MGKRARATVTAGMVLAGATAAFSPVASAAGQPTITVTNPKQCFVDTYSGSGATAAYVEHYAIVDVKGTGWTPGARVDVAFSETNEGVEKTAGAGGMFSGSFKVGDPAFGLENAPAYATGAVTATDTGNASGSDAGGATATSKPINYADRAVGVWENLSDVYGGNSDFFYRDKVYFKAAGFTPGKPVYAHYLFDGLNYSPSGKGKLITTFDLGKATGPCGSVTHKADIFPMQPTVAQMGDYTIQYSSSPAYSAATSEYGWIFNLGV